SPPCSAPFRAFVQQIVRKRFNNFLRDHARSRRHFDEGVDVYLVAEQGLSAALVLAEGPAGDPATTAVEREEHARLDEALQQLSTADRWLVQQLAAGLTQAEMAVALDVSRRTLGRRWARILANLRNCLVKLSE